MKILYNKEDGLNVINVLAFIDGFANRLGLDNLLIDVQKIESIINNISIDFPHKDGLEKASPFKQLANFIVYFISERPIREKITHKDFSDEINAKLKKIVNSENTLVALTVALTALHNAEIIDKDGNSVKIENPITLSQHSLIDIIDALSTATPKDHFKVVSVLLEQMTYKTNDHCQYEANCLSL
jgi:hypothetical protein